MAIITISRGSLSGGAELAGLIGKRLGYKVLSREVIVEAAKTYGVSQDRIESGLEQAPSLWSKFAGHAESYLLAVQATLAELVEGGDAVYHGHGGSFLLGGLPGVLKVRLIAPLSYRVESAIAQLGLTRQQAVAHIQEIDRQRERWVKSLYAEDWADPSHYDIVLNVGDMSLETASEIVACVASRKEYKWTPETAGVVRDFAIKNRVRAHLRFRSHYAEVVVNAQVHKSVVRLSGDAAFEAAKTEIAQFVRTVAGVERVALEREETAVLPGERTARELMIPISRYPNIRQSMQIRDAFIALGGSSVKLDDGHLIPPRYLLVFDDRDTLVGVLTRRDLLRGLSPEIRILERALESVAGVLPTQHADMGPQPGWTSLFSHAALQNARESVRSLMRGVKGVVNVEDPLSVVVRTMLTCEVDLVPVMEGQKAVGVVLMTDIFDAVTQFVTEGEPRRVR